jgi:hypothetical protein
MTGVGNSVFSSSRAKRLEQQVRQMDAAAAVRFTAPDGASVQIGSRVAANAFFRLMAGDPAGLPDRAMAVVARLDPFDAACDLEQVLIRAARGEFPTPPTQEN